MELVIGRHWTFICRRYAKKSSQYWNRSHLWWLRYNHFQLNIARNFNHE